MPKFIEWSISHSSEDKSNFVFLHIKLKIPNSKWLPFLERENCLKMGQSILQMYPRGQKFRRNHYLAPLRRYKQFCVLSKIRKFKMAAMFGERKFIFGERKNFFENGAKCLANVPRGRKFRRNCFILQGLGNTSNFVIWHFSQKIQKVKMAAVVGERKFTIVP